MDLGGIWTDLRARWDPPTAADYDDGIEFVPHRGTTRLTALDHQQHGVKTAISPPSCRSWPRSPETTTIRLGAGVILLPLAHPRHSSKEPVSSMSCPMVD